MKAFKLISLSGFLFCWTLQSYAQSTSNVVNSAIATPPNAAAFTENLKIPVGGFTGTPNIGVPLFTIKVDNFKLPIQLSYNARGIRPNIHAGWVGVGWNLIADGVINRKVNCLPDEYSFTSSSGLSTLNGLQTVNGGLDIGWFYPEIHSRLQTSDWNTADNIQHFTGIGLRAITPNNTQPQSNFAADSAPDEFDFNVNGLSGAFFMGEDGIWKVRSADGQTIKISVTTGSVLVNNQQTVNPNSTGGETILNTFLKFVLTTGDGISYTFGNDQSDDPNTTIDFNRVSQFSGSFGGLNNIFMLPMAWHITEIKLPTGKKIQYSYFRDRNQFTYNPYASSEYSVNVFTGVGTSNINHSFDYGMDIMDPVYLQNIIFPEGKLIFNASLSNEQDKLATGEVPNTIVPQISGLQFNDAAAVPAAYNSSVIFKSYPDLSNTGYNAQGNPISTWYKLNDIELDDYSGNKLKDFKLNYIQDANTRLFLNTLQETDFYQKPTGVSLPAYSFTYNSTVLPLYSTMHVDHWGFYNGPKTFPVPSDGNYFSTAYQSSYNQFREPDANYVQAGMLTKITYPTGGYTQFYYEPNKYLKWVGGNLPITVTPLAQEATGGGVRIAKITSTDNTTLTPITYEYSYVNDLTNNQSSGVLGMQRPVYSYSIINSNFFLYTENGTATLPTANLTYESWNTNSIYPSQNDDGNIVTYSNVIERQSNNGVYNGMKVTVYSNHDNGYANNSPDRALWTTATDMDLYHYSDRAFERGMVLSETVLKNNGDPIKKIENTYNNDLSRFDSFVKAIYCSVREQRVQSVSLSEDGEVVTPLNFFVPFLRTSAVRYYTFYPFLQQTIETDYPSTSGTPGTVTTTNYSYDVLFGTKNMISKTITDSKNEKVITNFRYPLEFTGNLIDDFGKGIQNLQALSAVSQPVEQYIQRAAADGSNIRTIDATLSNYDFIFPFSNIVYGLELNAPETNFIPANNSSGITKDVKYQPHVYLDNFDAVGNVLQTHQVSGMKAAYQWGYNNEHLTAVAKNAGNTYRQVTTTSVTSVGTSIHLIHPNTGQSYNSTFHVGASGNTVIAISPTGNPGNNVDAQVFVNLSSTNGYSNSITLCFATGTASCSSFLSSWTASNLPPGDYTVFTGFTSATSSGLQSDVNLSITSPDLTTVQSASGFNDIFYEGFEEGTGNATAGDSKTGHYSFTGTYNRTLQNIDNGIYTLNYWKKISGNWIWQTSSLTASSNSCTISLSGQIDDVRLYPQPAQMTTYTYDPLVGMTSSTDARGEVLYYEYDPFQRLMNVKDKDGNIIKNYSYHYQGQ